MSILLLKDMENIKILEAHRIGSYLVQVPRHYGILSHDFAGHLASHEL